MRPTAVLCLIVLLAIAQSPGAADTGKTAVVDRIVDGQAVLQFETDGEPTDQRVVAVDELPIDARHEGAVLQGVDGGYVYDESATERRSSNARRRFDRLTVRDGITGDSRVGTYRFGAYVRPWRC